MDITNEVLKLPNIKDKTPYDAQFSDNSVKYSISGKCVALVNSSAYTHRSVRTHANRPKRTFSKQERDIFYKGLRFYGIDFDMISYNLLPHRSRKQVYKFFLREDRKNRVDIEVALRVHRQNSKSRSAWIRETFKFPMAIENSPAEIECYDCNFASKILEYEEFVADNKPLPMVILDYEVLKLTNGLFDTEIATPSLDEVLAETAMMIED